MLAEAQRTAALPRVEALRPVLPLPLILLQALKPWLQSVLLSPRVSRPLEAAAPARNSRPAGLIFRHQLPFRPVRRMEKKMDMQELRASLALAQRRPALETTEDMASWAAAYMLEPSVQQALPVPQVVLPLFEPSSAAQPVPADTRLEAADKTAGQAAACTRVPLARPGPSALLPPVLASDTALAQVALQADGTSALVQLALQVDCTSAADCTSALALPAAPYNRRADPTSVACFAQRRGRSYTRAQMQLLLRYSGFA